MAVKIEEIIQQLEQARQQANAANLARYEAGLSELQQGRDALRRYYATAGDQIADITMSAREDVDRSAARNFATGEQDLISRGLANTTIRESLRRGVEDDRQRQLRSLDEDRRVALAGMSERQALQEANLSGNIAQFIAARDDVGPDPGLYASLVRDAQQTTEPIRATRFNYPGGGSLAARSRMTGGGGGGGGGGGSGLGFYASGGGGASKPTAQYFGPRNASGPSPAPRPDMVNLTENNLPSGTGKLKSGGVMYALQRKYSGI